MVNPLDPLELAPFLRNLKAEMPIHTETTAKIKRSYSQGMPKNLMEYSAHVDNKFLNDNLAIVEEIAYRDQKHPIPKWFRDYQIKHFAKFGILKADGFFVRDRIFGQMFPREIYHHASMSFHNPGFTSVIGNTKVLGSEIEIGTGAASNGAWGNNLLVLQSDQANYPVNAWYDRMAYKGRTGSTNMRMGIYDDSGSTEPVNLLRETGSFANSGGSYAYQSVTEFQIPTAKFWFGGVIDNAGFGGYFNSGGPMRYKSYTFGALPTPSGSPTGYTSTTENDTQKISHS